MKSKMTVLVIAPPGRLRTSLGVLLRASNHIQSIRYASDTCTGLRLLAEFIPQLILVDANLPDGKALELLNQLNCQDGLPPCLVLAHNEAQANQLLTIGAGQVLQIGFSTENFLETVARLMNDSP
jgi:DNA-binding NtrC family response regulator